MKIVIVGSAHSVHIRKIANNLVENGHQISVFSEESALTESSPQIYLKAVKLFDKWPADKKLRKLWFLIKLNIYLLRTNADIVWFVYASSYGQLTGRVLTSAKKVVSVWGSDILINSYKKAFSNKIGRSLNKADLIFSTSEFLRTHTRRLTSSKMILTPYGPNDSFFSEPSNVGKQNHDALTLSKSFDKVIVCTKWLKSVYGIDILINAIALDPSYFRRKNIGLLICGEGQDAALFKAIVNDEKISDIVKFVGYQEEQQVISLLDYASLAVFPSRSESFGVSLLECFSRQVPVVCSSAGGFSELSLGGRFGHVIDSLEPVEYLAAIKNVFESGPLYDIQKAQEYAKTFSWSTCMKHMESALTDLMNVSYRSKPKDFCSSENLERAVFIHCEPRIINSNLTRAREIRIAGFRHALTRRFSIQEICVGQLSKKGHSKMIRSVFDVSNPKMVYFEGTSSMLSSFSQRYSDLQNTLKISKARKTPFVYYLPDAHEYWDDYVISSRSATSVHLARYRKRKLLRLLVRYGATIAFPSGEFRDALLQKLDSKMQSSLMQARSIILPPAASGIAKIQTPTEQSISYVYAGGLGPFYKLHRLLISLNQCTTPLDVYFYVRKGDLAALEVKYKQLLLDSTIEIRHGSLPKDINGACSVGLLVLEPIDYISVAIPLKFYSYLERGWPILCYRDTAVGNIVSDNGLGWVIDPKVNDLSQFLESDKVVTDYVKIQKNIQTYIAENQWDNRVQQLVEVTQ